MAKMSYEKYDVRRRVTATMLPTDRNAENNKFQPSTCGLFIVVHINEHVLKVNESSILHMTSIERAAVLVESINHAYRFIITTSFFKIYDTPTKEHQNSEVCSLRR